MRCRTKILILFLTLILTFSIFALSVFAYEVGEIYTFKKEYTFDELKSLYSSSSHSTTLYGFLGATSYFSWADGSDSVRLVYCSDENASVYGKGNIAIGVLYSQAVSGDNYTLFVCVDGSVYSTLTSDGSYNFVMSGQTVYFDYELTFEITSSSKLYFNQFTAFNSCFPLYEEPVTFVSSVTSVITHVIGWIGTVISSLVIGDGALRPLLVLFAVPVSISAIFFGLRAVKKIIWGS